MALRGGFLLQAGDKLVYFAGDTGYCTSRIFSDIRGQLGPAELAILQIGGHDPRWFVAAQHADSGEAVHIMLDFEARSAIGIHFGYFQAHRRELESGHSSCGIPGAAGRSQARFLSTVHIFYGAYI